MGIVCTVSWICNKHNEADIDKNWFGLNIFYSSQDMIKDQAEQKAMFSPLQLVYNLTDSVMFIFQTVWLSIISC